MKKTNYLLLILCLLYYIPSAISQDGKFPFKEAKPIPNQIIFKFSSKLPVDVLNKKIIEAKNTIQQKYKTTITNEVLSSCYPNYQIWSWIGSTPSGAIEDGVKSKVEVEGVDVNRSFNDLVDIQRTIKQTPLPNDGYASPYLKEVVLSNNIGKQAIKIGVLDSGIGEKGTLKPQHSFLKPYIDFVNARNFTTTLPDNNVTDVVGHGTSVTGIIGTILNLNKAEKVKIIPVKIIDDKGNTNFWLMMKGLAYLTCEQKVNVINTSIGGYVSNKTLTLIQVFLQEMMDKNDVLLASSAGNAGMNANAQGYNHLPSDFKTDKTMAVAAIDKKGYLANVSGIWGSNWGNVIDIAAPGVDINCAVINTATGFDLRNGTSYSAPFVAAAASILGTLQPSFAAAKIKCTLLNSATSDPNLTQAQVPCQRVLNLNVASTQVLNPCLVQECIDSRNDHEAGSTEEIGDNFMKVYPNPFEHDVNFVLYSAVEKDAKLAILDDMGRTITEQKITLNAGKSYLNYPLAHLAPGMYVAILSSNDFRYIQKIVKKQ